MVKYQPSAFISNLPPDYTNTENDISDNQGILKWFLSSDTNGYLVHNNFY